MDRAKVTELCEKRAGLHKEMCELLDSADDTGNLSAEDRTKFDALESDFDSLTRNIDSANKLLGIDPLASVRGVKPDDEELREHGIDPDKLREPENRETVLQSDEYREEFCNWLKRGDAYLESAEYRAGGAASLNVGTNTEGGYTVPREFWHQMVQDALVFGAIRQLAFVFSTSTGATLDIPNEATKGVAAWTLEEATYAESEPTFGQKQLSAFKATREIVTSKELIQDSAFDIETYLRELAGQSFALLENTAFVLGSGTGQPKGFIADVPAGNVFTATAGNTTSVTADFLIDTTYKLKRPYRQRAAWVLNDTTEQAIRKLKDTTNQYIWQPGLQAGAPDTLLGRPVFADPDMPVMAVSANSIAFGDFQGYWIRDVQDMSIQRLNELHARNGQVGFLFDKRVDGKLIHAERIALYKNSAT